MCHTITGCGSQETTQKSGKKRSWLPSPVSFCSAPPLEIRVIRDCEPFRLVLLLKGNHKIWKQISLFGIIQVFFIKQYTDFIEQLKIYTRNNSFFSVFFFLIWLSSDLITQFPSWKGHLFLTAVLSLLSSKYCFQASSLPLLRLYLHLLRKQILEGSKNWPPPKLFFQIRFLHRVQLTF